MSKSIVAVMPCLGRQERTIDLVPRLIRTAGTEDWELSLVVDNDNPLHSALLRAITPQRIPVNILRTNQPDERGYWYAMRRGCKESNAPLVVNLANDLLPGRDWLRRALEAYNQRFADGLGGVMGFNDGVHMGGQAAHFLAARAFLRQWFGDDEWPLAYQHNFGDTEICRRAQAAGRFAVAPWAVLYHDHPVSGGANDEVYQRGAAGWKQDEALFKQRSAQWSF